MLPSVDSPAWQSSTTAVVTVDRPERRNAIDEATAEALGDAWERFDEDDALVGVLTGSEGTFPAGADLKATDLEDRPEGWLGFTRTRVAKPTVAAIEGHRVAGGLEMALWCDLRVASRSATFGCFERRFGVPLVDGGTQRLPHVVGLGRALELVLTGRELDAETAKEWGLVNGSRRRRPSGPRSSWPRSSPASRRRRSGPTVRRCTTASGRRCSRASRRRGGTAPGR
jgi:enoyl-CoA hydratase